MFRALIDTGATHTAITKNAAEKLGILPLGKLKTIGVHGPQLSPYYSFKIGFIQHQYDPGGSGGNQMKILDDIIKGTELGFDNSNFDVLLGMNVLSRGDLTIRRNGTFQFQFP